MTFGLKVDAIKKICNVFASFPEVKQAIIYGSRAKGNFKPASDIDLVLMGEELNTSIVNKISWELDDLLLPYTFDLSIYHKIQNNELLAHIERAGKIFFDKNNAL